MWWNYLSIHKIQRVHHLIDIHVLWSYILYNACNYLSIIQMADMLLYACCVHWIQLRVWQCQYDSPNRSYLWSNSLYTYWILSTEINKRTVLQWTKILNKIIPAGNTQVCTHQSARPSVTPFMTQNDLYWTSVIKIVFLGYNRKCTG